jgi:hypothetical protein
MSRGITPPVLYTETRWRWLISFTPQLLYPQEEIRRLPFEQDFWWAPKPVWTHWRRCILAMTEIEPIFLGLPAHSLVRGESLICIQFVLVLGVHCFTNRWDNEVCVTSKRSLSQGRRTVEFVRYIALLGKHVRYIALLGKQKSLYRHFSGESNGEG